MGIFKEFSHILLMKIQDNTIIKGDLARVYVHRFKKMFMMFNSVYPLLFILTDLFENRI